jgi:hypothetical protein
MLRKVARDACGQYENNSDHDHAKVCLEELRQKTIAQTEGAKLLAPKLA